MINTYWHKKGITVHLLGDGTTVQALALVIDLSLCSAGPPVATVTTVSRETWRLSRILSCVMNLMVMKGPSAQRRIRGYWKNKPRGQLHKTPLSVVFAREMPGISAWFLRGLRADGSPPRHHWASRRVTWVVSASVKPVKRPAVSRLCSQQVRRMQRNQVWLSVLVSLHLSYALKIYTNHNETLWIIHSRPAHTPQSTVSSGVKWSEVVLNQLFRPLIMHKLAVLI